MKSKKNLMAQSVLVILKLDSKNLFDRIKNRKTDYLNEFSLKRTREHFKDIFRNRYKGTSLKDLKYCGQEVLIALDQFYTRVDDLEWYLNHTQDMANSIEDKIDGIIRVLAKNYEMLALYIDADLGIESGGEGEESYFSEGGEEGQESVPSDGTPDFLESSALPESEEDWMKSHGPPDSHGEEDTH